MLYVALCYKKPRFTRCKASCDLSAEAEGGTTSSYLGPTHAITDLPEERFMAFLILSLSTSRTAVNSVKINHWQTFTRLNKKWFV